MSRLMKDIDINKYGKRQGAFIVRHCIFVTHCTLTPGIILEEQC